MLFLFQRAPSTLLCQQARRTASCSPPTSRSKARPASSNTSTIHISRHITRGTIDSPLALFPQLNHPPPPAPFSTSSNTHDPPTFIDQSLEHHPQPTRTVLRVRPRSHETTTTTSIFTPLSTQTDVLRVADRMQMTPILPSIPHLPARQRPDPRW